MNFENHYSGLAFITPESVDSVILYIKNLFELPEDARVNFGMSDEFTIKKGNKTVVHGKVSFDLTLKKPVLIVNSLDDVFFKSKIISCEEKAIVRIKPLYKGYSGFACRKAYNFKFYDDSHDFSCYLFLYKKHTVFKFKYSEISNPDTYLKMFCQKIFSDNIIKDVDSADMIYNNFNQLVDLKEIVEYN